MISKVDVMIYDFVNCRKKNPHLALENMEVKKKKQAGILGFQLGMNIKASSIHLIREKIKMRKKRSSVSPGAQCQLPKGSEVARPVHP